MSPTLNAFALKLRRMERSGWTTALQHFILHDLDNALRAILTDAAAFAAVMDGAYLHGNGFAKIVLGRSDRLVLRLHVADGSSEDNIHDHRWFFASAVVRGAMWNEVFEDDPSGDVIPEFRYTRTGATRTAEPLLAARIRTTGRQQIRVGGAYSLDPGRLHRIEWEAGCMTLVATDVPSSSTCRLLSREGQPNACGRPISEAAVRTYLQAIAAQGNV